MDSTSGVPPMVPTGAEVLPPSMIPTGGSEAFPPLVTPAGADAGLPTAGLTSTETLPEAAPWSASPAVPSVSAPLSGARRAHAKGVSAAGLATIAVLVMLVGAWGGIVPFVGPIFSFSADGSPSWYWDLAHALLWLAPGAIAVLVGFAMLSQASRVKAERARFGLTVTGLVAVVSGAWFVVGPWAWPVFKSGGVVFSPASPTRELLYQVGWSLGPGMMLVLLGGCAIGFALRR